MDNTQLTAALTKAERRNRQLWLIAMLVILALTIAIIGINAPDLVDAPKEFAGPAKTYLWSLSALVLLFCAYILWATSMLRTLRLELVQTELEKAYIAHHDAVTGLPTRRLMMDRLDQALVRLPWRKRQLAVLYLDLDRFKRINETLGHAVGDATLKAVAERLMGCVRDGDTVSRQSGDEFIVILVDLAREEDAYRIVEKVFRAIVAPFRMQERDLFLTVSMGISLFPADGEQGETLVKHAESAMYRAKELGRNRYQMYSPAQHARAVERLSLETSLLRALEREEFSLHYQPQIDIRTKRIIGMEALLRWQPPGAPMVPPGTFVPVAEEIGLIVPMGEWVLRAACRQNKRWQEAGLPAIPVSVNLSGRQLKEPNLAKTVERVLQETALNPGHLELELTESTMQDPEQALELLAQLSIMGVRIAIDDFGTGYSSLNYLKRLPIHKLKIDLSFVRQITTDHNDAAIVSAIITLAHSLDLKAIAEGVETQAQLDYLHGLQCDEVQGYLFSRPVPAPDASHLLAKMA
ncbi:MAG: EAL domain-containing protein [Nitrospirota bacterium]